MVATRKIKERRRTNTDCLTTELTRAVEKWDNHDGDILPTCQAKSICPIELY